MCAPSPIRVEPSIVLPSVRALLTEIIDYAGLFPPARLDMSDAVGRYLRHLASPDGWMLARFVAPAARLGELSMLLDDPHPEPLPIRLAVLVRASHLSSDLADTAVFADRHARQTGVDQLELRLPEGAEDPAAVVERSLLEIHSRFPAALPFFEPSLLDGRPESLSRTTDALAAAAAAGAAVGLKIRCGGLDASAVPSSWAVAVALAAARRAGVPLKATQGLHQPVRHHDAGLGTTAHGFLNVFVAGVLGHAHALPEPELQAIVEEEGTAAFQFRDDGLAWGGLAAGLDDIAAARRAAVTSFGSCSFSEPRDALRELGLIRGDAPPGSSPAALRGEDD